MADITDPVVIRFSNEQIRPACEELMKVHAVFTAMKIDWDTVIDPILVAASHVSGDLLEDERGPRGVTRITKQDIDRVITVIDSVLTQMNAANVLTWINKPTVRQQTF